MWPVLFAEFGVVCLWVAWRLTRAANEWTKRRDFLAPSVAFPIAYLAWFALGSANIVVAPRSFMDGMFRPIPGRVWAYFLLGLVAYLLGVRLAGARGSVDPDHVHFRSEWDASKFWVLTGLLAAVMLGGYVGQAYQSGLDVLTALESGKRPSFAGIPHFLFITAAFSLAALVPAYLWTQKASRRATVTGTLLVALALVLLLSEGSRADPTQALLAAFLLYHYLRKKRSLAGYAGRGILAILVLSALGYLRDYLVTGGTGVSWAAQLGIPGWVVPALYVLFYVRYTVTTFYEVTRIIPRYVPYQRGVLFMRPFESFLPGRHPASDLFFKHILGSQFVGQGQPATILGPLYGDFGGAGIFAGMFFFGFAGAVLYRWAVRRRTLLGALLYAWFLLSVFLGLFGGVLTYITALTTPLLWVGFDILATRPRAARGNRPDAPDSVYGEAGPTKRGPAPLRGTA